MAMMKAAFEVVGFEMVDPKFLVPHPAAEVPIDAEDVASIERSIAEHEILHPLLVSEEGAEGFRRIFDGVNRWKTALRMKMEAVPCLVVRCENPAMIVAESLAAGRKRSTGQRILVFLEAQREAIMEAREKGRQISKGGAANFKNVQQNAGVSFETPESLNFSAGRISTLLKCSKPDVVSALELFEALHTGTVPDNLSSGRRAHGADEGELAGLREQRNQVLSGHSPVRAWKRAFFGKQATEGVARAEIQYASVFDRGLSSLITALPKWTSFSHGDKAIFEEKFAKMLNMLPDDLKVLLK